jgi:DNA repair protein RecO (recombination protein O)
MTEILKDRAVIRRTFDFGESSIVAVALTREHGKVRLLAKGARGRGSAFYGDLRTGNLGEVVFYFRDERGLQLLKEIESRSTFNSGREDLERLCILQAGLEVVDRSIVERESDERAFDLLESFIMALPSCKDPWTVFFGLEIQLLLVAGLFPQADRCDICKNPLTGGSLGVNPSSGVVTCGACGDAGTIYLSPASFVAFSRLKDCGPVGLDGVELSPEQRGEIGKLLHSMFLSQIDGYRLPLALRILKGVNRH